MIANKGHEGHDNIGRMTVEILPPAVIDGRRPGIGVACCDLDVTQRHSSVQCRHDERCAQHVGMDNPEAGALPDRSDPAVRRASVESLAVTTMQDWSFASLAKGEVNVRATLGTRGITAGLFPFPMMRRVRWPRSKARSSAAVAQASLTRSPFRPNKVARAAWSGSQRSAVKRNRPSSPRSRPRPSLG